MALTGSHLWDNPNYVLSSLDKHGASYEHKFAVVAGRNMQHLEEMRRLLADYDGHVVKNISWAVESILSPSYMDLYKEYHMFAEELLGSKFYDLDSIYESIEKACLMLADAYVSADVIQAWWKKSRARARSLAGKLNQLSVSSLPLDEMVSLWDQYAPLYFNSL